MVAQVNRLDWTKSYRAFESLPCNDPSSVTARNRSHLARETESKLERRGADLIWGEALGNTNRLAGCKSAGRLRESIGGVLVTGFGQHESVNMIDPGALLLNRT